LITTRDVFAEEIHKKCVCDRGSPGDPVVGWGGGHPSPLFTPSTLKTFWLLASSVPQHFPQ